jgi:dissimilatory sulfite reductase (desulfoviridin) alpha/beta subunit
MSTSWIWSEALRYPKSFAKKGKTVVKKLEDDRAEAISLAARVLDWYKDTNKKKRLGRIIDEIGLATFKAELGLPAE